MHALNIWHGTYGLYHYVQLRLAGNACAGQGDFKQAIELYKRALELQPSSGTHMLYSNMSAALLQVRTVHAA